MATAKTKSTIEESFAHFCTLLKEIAPSAQRADAFRILEEYQKAYANERKKLVELLHESTDRIEELTTELQGRGTPVSGEKVAAGLHNAVSEARHFLSKSEVDEIRQQLEEALESLTNPDETQTERVAIIEKAAEFFVHTSQEMYALYCAQADGKTGRGYQRNDQAGTICHQQSGSPHLVRMELTEAERAAGLALDYLEALARSQDADAVLATSYILGVLAPPPHLPARPYAGGWIDFDDVLKKIGWIPRDTKDRRRMHDKIWNFVKFGERANIVGKRTGKYQMDGQEVNTSIQAAAWRVMKTENPQAPGSLNLFATLETPIRAEIVISRELTALITNPNVAQYFQCGEVLGGIPNGKPGGAWARVIGLALLSFWRRKPREHRAGTLKPTRRELLNHLAAKIAPYDEILESPNPSRAIDYWCDALQILADEQFIERSGEAAITAKEIKSALPRKNWQKLWLDQTVSIEPGAKTKPVFEKVLTALPALKARDLKKKPRAKKRPKA